MADEPVSLIDNVMPAQGMPLGGMVDEEIEIEEIEEPTDIVEEEDGSVVLNFEEAIKTQLMAEPDAIWPSFWKNGYWPISPPSFWGTMRTTRAGARIGRMPIPRVSGFLASSMKIAKNLSAAPVVSPIL